MRAGPPMHITPPLLPVSTDEWSMDRGNTHAASIFTHVTVLMSVAWLTVRYDIAVLALARSLLQFHLWSSVVAEAQNRKSRVVDERV
jgi:hypothetical protein